MLLSARLISVIQLTLKILKIVKEKSGHKVKL